MQPHRYHVPPPELPIVAPKISRPSHCKFPTLAEPVPSILPLDIESLPEPPWAPLNRAVPPVTASAVSPLPPDLTKTKLIDYDSVKYGSSAERKRLLKKWDDEVGSLPIN